ISGDDTRVRRRWATAAPTSPRLDGPASVGQRSRVSTEKVEEQRAVSAGRGLLYITFAKLWFMVGGYAILFALPHVLDRDLVGQWSVILGWVSWPNNVMVNATIQGVSRSGSVGQPSQRAALRLLLLVGGAAAL